MVKNIVLKVGVYYACVAVPKDLQGILNKSKYLKKLNSTTAPKAAIEAQRFIPKWKSQIQVAKGALKLRSQSRLDDDTQFALNISKALNSESDQFSKDILEMVLHDVAEGAEEKSGLKKAKELYDIGTGTKTPLPLFVDGWLSSLSGYAPKTRDVYTKDVHLFISHFRHLETITRPSMRAWVAKLMLEGKTLHTISSRLLPAIKHFYNYIDNHGHISPDATDPFYKVVPKQAKTKVSQTSKGWLPLSPDEVSLIYNTIPTSDTQLKLLVTVAMYTGCRIEEICSLKCEQVKVVNHLLCIVLTDSKTVKGIRTIPVATKLTQAVTRALEVSEDGFLVSGLTFNKYGDRSNAVGKRFGRLKKELGFSSKQVFHSIRKCVVTQLEQSGVPESIVADLVGHEKQTITYGLYSGGSSLGSILGAVEMLNYP
jgi:integrase